MARPLSHPARLRSHAKHAPDLSVGFVLTPNYTWLPVAAFIDAMRLAGDEGDRSRRIACNWTVMTEDAAPVMACCGLQISPCQPFVDPTSFDYIAVTGGPLHLARDDEPAVTAYLRRAAMLRVPLIGLGAGSFVLARAGLMEGRRCCVNWYVLDEFKERFPALMPIADQLFLVDGESHHLRGRNGRDRPRGVSNRAPLR
jgi:transcriptional regulator GlxA family with amidase domain